uniref:Uncharacterized protein n=1 Tax=Magallana gigas TaxID=29159 RepID=A0A8W8P5D6_MAGGI
MSGWHRRMNVKAHGLSLPLYHLIPLLLREAELVKTRIAACDLERNVRQIVTTTQKKIEDAAARYMEDIITASHFVKVCGSIYAGVFDV